MEPKYLISKPLVLVKDIRDGSSVSKGNSSLHFQDDIWNSGYKCSFLATPTESILTSQTTLKRCHNND